MYFPSHTKVLCTLPAPQWIIMGQGGAPPRQITEEFTPRGTGETVMLAVNQVSNWKGCCDKRVLSRGISSKKSFILDFFFKKIVSL